MAELKRIKGEDRPSETTYDQLFQIFFQSNAALPENQTNFAGKIDCLNLLFDYLATKWREEARSYFAKRNVRLTA